MTPTDPPILRNSALAAPLVVIGVALVLGPMEALGTAVGSAAMIGNLWLLSLLAPRFVASMADEHPKSPPVFWAVALLAKFVLLIGLFVALFKVLPAFGVALGFVPLMVGALATGIHLALTETEAEADPNRAAPPARAPDRDRGGRMRFASGFSWFRLIPAVDHDELVKALGIDQHFVPGHEVADTSVYLGAFLAAALLVVFAGVARMGLERAKAQTGIAKYLTSDRPTPLAFAEVYVGGILGLMNDLLDKRDARLFFPLIAGLFGYIFFCNIQSILPGFLPPTDNINTNVGMALIVFLTFNAVGLFRDPVGYISHLAGPTWLLAWFMLPLEVLSLCIRPVSLSIRLTANMFGDHVVYGVMGPFPVLPAALLVLACVVSVVQAFVFSLLTVIYIHLALPHHEHESDAHAH